MAQSVECLSCKIKDLSSLHRIRTKSQVLRHKSHNPVREGTEWSTGTSLLASLADKIQDKRLCIKEDGQCSWGPHCKHSLYFLMHHTYVHAHQQKYAIQEHVHKHQHIKEIIKQKTSVAGLRQAAGQDFRGFCSTRDSNDELMQVMPAGQGKRRRTGSTAEVDSTTDLSRPHRKASNVLRKPTSTGSFQGLSGTNMTGTSVILDHQPYTSSQTPRWRLGYDPEEKEIKRLKILPINLRNLSKDFRWC